MTPLRIIKEHDGRFAARNDAHPKIVGRGATEAEARADFEQRLAAVLRDEADGFGADHEDWSGKPYDAWKD